MSGFWSRLALGWALVVAAGWAGYYLAGGGGDERYLAASRAAGWLAGVPLAVVLGLVLLRLAKRSRPMPPVAALLVVATGAWGMANAVGWTVDVAVGGPATGLATGCVLVAAGDPRTGPDRVRLFGVILCGVAAMVTGRLVAGVDALVPRVVLPVVLGIAVAAAAWRAVGLRRSFRPVVIVVLAWTVSWLGAFELARNLPAGLPPAVYAVTEIGLACGCGGALTALVWRSRSEERPGAVALRWAAAGILGTLVGLVVAAAMWSGGVMPPRVDEAADLWAAGTTFGLGLAAAVALAPTLARTGRMTPAETSS